MNVEKTDPPTTWARTSLQSVVEVHYGKSLTGKHRSATGIYPVVGSSGIVGMHSEKLVDGACIVIGRKGSVGAAYFIAKPCWPIDTTYYIQTPQGFELRYLYYLLGSLELVRLDKSTTIPGLNRDDLYRVATAIAPMEEQKRIVEKLEELLSDLNVGVAELKIAQKKLTQYRQSLLKAAVEGALTAEWRQQNQPKETGAQLLERILQERRARWEAKQLAKFKEQGKVPAADWRQKYVEPVKPNVGDLPDLPSGWFWIRVSAAGDVQLGRQRAPQFHSGANMVPYLRVANVFEERIDISDVMEMHFSSEEEETYCLHYNDILLNEGQSLELIGRPAIFRNELERVCFTNTLVRFKSSPMLMPEFALLVFLHYMHSGRFRKIASITTNIAHLGAGRFSDLEFPFPNPEEQSAIVELYQRFKDDINNQQAAVLRALKQSAAQRKNILKAAFSGQLVPQDPNDEPASILLQRIRAEREVKAEQAKVHKSSGRKKRESA